MLSLVTKASKYPSLITVKFKDECDFYITFLYSILISNSKQYHPSMWWSNEVTNLLLVLHLEYLISLGNDSQNFDWLLGKTEKSKRKSDTKPKLGDRNNLQVTP